MFLPNHLLTQNSINIISFAVENEPLCSPLWGLLGGEISSFVNSYFFVGYVPVDSKVISQKHLFTCRVDPISR